MHYNFVIIWDNRARFWRCIGTLLAWFSSSDNYLKSLVIFQAAAVATAAAAAGNNAESFPGPSGLQQHGTVDLENCQQEPLKPGMTSFGLQVEFTAPVSVCLNSIWPCDAIW